MLPTNKYITLLFLCLVHKIETNFGHVLQKRGTQQILPQVAERRHGKSWKLQSTKKQLDAVLKLNNLLILFESL